MKLARIAYLASAAALAISAVPAHAALLDGNSIHVDYLFPNTSTVFTNYGDHAVSGSTLIGTDIAGLMTLYASDSGLTFTLNSGTGGYVNTAFNGVRISDANGTINPFTSVTLGADSNTFDINTNAAYAFDSSRITFDANNIYINFAGLSFRRGDVIALDLNGGSSAAPEPASWAMMVAGFGLIGGAVRRRKATVAFA